MFCMLFVTLTRQSSLRQMNSVHSCMNLVVMLDDSHRLAYYDDIIHTKLSYGEGYNIGVHY